MKRCPQCAREYDVSMSFCLDDGCELLYGPASADEPATAIQPSAESIGQTSVSGKSMVDKTVVLSERSDPGYNYRPPSSAEYIVTEAGKHRGVVVVLAAVVLLAAVGLGYFYVKRPRTALTSSPISSVAVLPFQNKSSDPDTDYLSDGLAESLIFRLTQLPGLKVSPTTSVMRYKDKDTDVGKIASDLGVEAVMTGRLMKRGDSLNITVELVDVRSNKSLWGEQYERKMSDLLALQREITTTIIQKLQLKLIGNEKAITKKYTDSNEAYQQYLNARFHFARRTKEEIYKSIDLYRQAVDTDPNFALAYAGLAEAWEVIPSYPYAPPSECVPKARAAAAKAMELDPDLPEAHTVAGMIAANYDWDWAAAEREFKRSLEIDPNLAITHYRYAWTFLSPMGRHDEAIAEMKKATELEPLSLVQGGNFAGVLLYARRYDEGIAQAQKVVDLDPTFLVGKIWLAHNYIAAGKYAEALAIAEPSLNTNNPFLSDAGLAYARMGERDKALAIIARWKEAERHEYVLNYLEAQVYAALGDKDGAFAELEKAYQNHDWFLQRIKVDPTLDPLRDDPRFDAMVKRLNFPQ